MIDKILKTIVNNSWKNFFKIFIKNKKIRYKKNFQNKYIKKINFFKKFQ